MNLLRDALTSQEEIDRARRLEQIRRQGHKFIEVRYTGPMQYPNPRIKQVHDIVLYTEVNQENGGAEYKTREGTSEISFEQNSVGDRTAYVYDDDYNRQFLANHDGYGLEICDPQVRAEIKALIGKSYKVEVGEIESLERQKRDIDRKIEELKAKGEADNNGIVLNTEPIKPPNKLRRAYGRQAHRIRLPMPGATQQVEGTPQVVAPAETMRMSVGAQTSP